jgi:hypothetical protein
MDKGRQDFSRIVFRWSADAALSMTPEVKPISSPTSGLG